jgi:hypothetical protein
MERALSLDFLACRIGSAKSVLRARPCENSVHGSTWLTTNGRENTVITYLSVRPELGRRAPKVFSHSISCTSGTTLRMKMVAFHYGKRRLHVFS